jgi:hypothetical protein
LSAAGDAPWRWTARGLLRAGGIAAVAVFTGAALGYVVAHEPAPRDDAARAPGPGDAVNAELALLAPLREGSTLEGFDVAEIHPIGDDGVLRIVCRRAHVAVQLEVTLAAPAGGAGRYVVSPSLQNATAAEGDRLAASLAAILEAKVGAPPPRLRRSAF